VIRREVFGGIIFDDRSHKSFKLNKPSFRIVELYYVQKEGVSEIKKSLYNEFALSFSEKDINDFLYSLSSHFDKKILNTQRGNNFIGVWNGQSINTHLSSPLSVYWTFTNSCNLACTHCAWNSGKPLSDELSLEECYQIMEDLNNMGIFELSFSGGEPLVLKKKLLNLAKYAAELGFHLNLATNATLITEETAEDLLKAGFHEIQVSVEGFEAHDTIRGKGIFEKTINGIKTLKKAGLEITFAVAINKTNLNEVEGIIDLAKSLVIPHVRFVRFVPIGRGRVNLTQFEMNREEELNLAKKLWRKKWENLGLLNIMTNKHYVSAGLLFEPGVAHADNEDFSWEWDCPAGRTRACIMPAGDVAPCPLLGSLGVTGGNLRRRTFSDIWNNSQLFIDIRNEKRYKNEKCGNCRYWTLCKGGCKASSYANFGSLFQEDPLCFLKDKDVNENS